MRSPSAPLVLASTSPRRRELVKLLGSAFETVSVDVDETPRPGESPEDLVRRLCRAKATRGGALRPDAVIIAADTVVALEQTSAREQGTAAEAANVEILGKPHDLADAERMLRLLRARAHLVYSGVATTRGGKEIVQVVRTTVWMRDYRDDEIRAYVATEEPLDKAAAYAIQDPRFHPAARIDGCYANVMGLPLCRLYEALSHFLSLPGPALDCFSHPEVKCTVPSLLENSTLGS